MSSKKESEIVIRSLTDRDAVRTRPGMYIGSVSNPDVIFREVIDGSFDESYATGCDQIIISTNLNGYYFVADNGRGIPITMSIDDPTQTQCKLAIGKLHAGSSFENTDGEVRAGMHGCGEAAANFLSSEFIVLSRITPDNYDKSIPEVKQLWDSSGPTIRKNLYYTLVYKEGLLVYEGAYKRSDLEKTLFSGKTKKAYTELPTDMSTMVLFKPDPKIFDSVKAELPIQNIQNFLLIQEKYYKRKVNVWADGTILKSSGFKPYNFEFIKTIVPADPSLNSQISVYVTFETDPNLGSKSESGSVNGLTVNQGVHISWIEQFYEEALRNEYKISHKCIFQGFKVHVLLLAGEVLYDSQTKVRLRSISKVKQSDLEEPIVKEFQKIFRKNSDYWEAHVEKLNLLAESMKSISATEKAQKMMESAAGNSVYRMKSKFIDSFTDATAGQNDRWNCELFICFTGDTEILTCNDEKINFIDLTKRISSGESIYTFSCRENGKIVPAKIIRSELIKHVDKLCKITLDNGEIIKCTLDHKIMMRDGSYKQAADLSIGDSLMPCYITKSDNYDNMERRVVLDMSGDSSLKHYRPNEISYKNNGVLVPIYHIMSEHVDTNIDDSSKVSNVKISRHHLDLNKFNDYPNNLLLCSQEKHYSFHADYLISQASKNPRVNKKLKKETREKISNSRKLMFQTDHGQELKKIIKANSIKEWSNPELRKWRSEETRRYSQINKGWGKLISSKGKINWYSNTVISEVKNNLVSKGLELTSSNFNKEIVLLRLQKNKEKYASFNKIFKTCPELLKDFTITENDSVDYQRALIVLDKLKNKSLDINLDNFNKEILDLFEKPKGRNIITQGRGYVSSKKKFPELFKKYESICNDNHKVVSVELFDVVNEPVYCLEVDAPEHNFPLAAGVFVKNCEGKSPYGSLKAGRKDCKHIAVMGLRGKVLNTVDKTADQMLDNAEMNSIFMAIGLGLDCNNVTNGCSTPEEAYDRIRKNSRYGKIVISTDADLAKSLKI